MKIASIASLRAHGADHLREFRLECGLPVWIYDIDGITIEKRVFLPLPAKHRLYDLSRDFRAPNR